MIPYTYVALRYIHDTTTDEFVNVGVVLVAPGATFIGAKCRRTMGRLSKVFPGIRGESFRANIRYIEDQINGLGTRARTELQLDTKRNALQVAQIVLPTDDSSLQWSPVGNGLTNDPAGELQKLFHRMVEYYDDKNVKERRSDDEVWRSFKRELDQRNLPDHQILSEVLQEKTISVKDDEITFKHAWKNGSWHCLEPLSFDLSSADTIKEKAHKWLGQMTSVQGSVEQFKVIFLVGAPREPDLQGAFRNALSILEKAPVDKQVCLETDFGICAAQVENDVRAHDQAIQNIGITTAPE